MESESYGDASAEHPPLEIPGDSERVGQLLRQVADLKLMCEELQADNRKLKAQRASLVAVSSLPAGETVEYSDMDVESKVTYFLHKTFGLRQPRTVFAREDLQILALNSLVCLHQLDFSADLGSSELSLAPSQADFDDESEHGPTWKVANTAFRYALLFLKQLSEEMQVERRRVALTVSYPLQWLLGVFPSEFPAGPVDNPSSLPWLPAHCMLAANPLSNCVDDTEAYINDLGDVLDCFEQSALGEDVRPLSIAVAKREPCLTAVEYILSRSPDSAYAADADGSIAIMHACACNDDDRCARLLLGVRDEPPDPAALRKQKQQLRHVDNFGCSAVHYAAFSGRSETLQLLLALSRELADCRESNGALPLHDAVQNARGWKEQYCLAKLLLEVSPKSAARRDDRGALPLHYAARHSDLFVVRLLHAAYPQAVFAADEEELLPLHYFSERADKAEAQEVQSFLLAQNPTSLVKSDAQLNAQDAPSAKSGVTSWASSWFRGGKKDSAPGAPAATAAAAAPAAQRAKRSSVTHLQSKRMSTVASRR